MVWEKTEWISMWWYDIGKDGIVFNETVKNRSGRNNADRKQQVTTESDMKQQDR